MPRSDTREIVRTVLKLYGRTFAEDLGICAMENQPSPLFCLLISALLFRTSTMVGETAQTLIDLYQGDLRKLRTAAEVDPVQERKLLDQFKGVGDVAIDIFFREAQLAWPELFPFADERALASAKKLGLPADRRKLTSLVRGRENFVRLVSALVRIQLEHKHDEILAAAHKPDFNMHGRRRTLKNPL